MEIGEAILEIGCGTGSSLKTLAEYIGEYEEVVGMDTSTSMLKIARNRKRKEKLSDKVEKVCIDAAKRPFRKSSFNVVLMSFTLEVFDTSEIPYVLFECKKALQNNGSIQVVVMSKSKIEEKTLIVRLYEWIHRQLPIYVENSPILFKEILKNEGFSITRKEHFSTWRLSVAVVFVKTK